MRMMMKLKPEVKAEEKIKRRFFYFHNAKFTTNSVLSENAYRELAEPVQIKEQNEIVRRAFTEKTKSDQPSLFLMSFAYGFNFIQACGAMITTVTSIALGDAFMSAFSGAYTLLFSALVTHRYYKSLKQTKQKTAKNLLNDSRITNQKIRMELEGLVAENKCEQSATTNNQQLNLPAETQVTLVRAIESVEPMVSTASTVTIESTETAEPFETVELEKIRLTNTTKSGQ